MILDEKNEQYSITSQGTKKFSCSIITPMVGQHYSIDKANTALIFSNLLNI